MTIALLEDLTDGFELTRFEAYFWKGVEDRPPQRKIDPKRQSTLAKEWARFDREAQALLLSRLANINQNWTSLGAISQSKVKWIENFRVDGLKIYEVKDDKQRRLAFFIFEGNLYFFYCCRKKKMKWEAGDLTQANNEAVELLSYLKKGRDHFEVLPTVH